MFRLLILVFTSSIISESISRSNVVSENMVRLDPLIANKVVLVVHRYAVLHISFSVDAYRSIYFMTQHYIKLESDKCGISTPEYYPHITINRTLPSIKRPDKAFELLLDDMLTIVLPGDTVNVKYIPNLISTYRDASSTLTTVLIPTDYVYVQLLYIGCMPFFTARGDLYSSCTTKPTQAVRIKKITYSIFTKVGGWYCLGTEVDKRYRIEAPNITIYSIINNNSALVIPNNEIIVVNNIAPKDFSSMSLTAKIDSDIVNCQKWKICLINNLTTRNLYSINTVTLEVYQLTNQTNRKQEKEMSDYQLPDYVYRLLNETLNEPTSIDDILFVPVDSQYSTTIIFLTIILAILLIIILFLTGLTIKLLHSKKSEKSKRKVIYRKLQEDRQNLNTVDAAPESATSQV